MSTNSQGCGCLIGMLLLYLGILALVGGATMALWNWIAVSSFHAQPITLLMGVGVWLAFSVVLGIFRLVLAVLASLL